MTTTKSRKVTKLQAEKVLAQVKKTFAAWIDGPDSGPYLNMEWDWSGKPTPTIIWEGGPYDWTMLFPHGGRDEDFGFSYAAVTLPKGVWTEPYSGWALSLYKE